MTRHDQCDLAVVGAGPAGMAAAIEAARLGLSTVVLDEQVEPGGQIYRGITHPPLRERTVLGPDYWHGAPLIESFLRSGARRESGATVWAILAGQADAPPLANRANGPGSAVHAETTRHDIAYSVDGQARLLHARHILLATGAQERPFPVPGWTLPGVMTAGGAQILLKSSGLVPDGRTVLAGCGPLLYLLAWQYLNAGARIDALLDTTPAGQMRRALPHAWEFLRSPYFAKGLRLLRAVRAALPVVRGVDALQAQGDGRLQSVRYQVRGTWRTLPADQLLLHQGVIPNINLSQAAGIPHRWNDRQACWEPEASEWGATAVAHIGIAGDGAGIAGALAAEYRGRMAALEAARALGCIDQTRRDREAIPMRAALRRALQGRAFFDTLYRPAAALRRPEGDTIACRCEEVTAEQVRSAARLGCQGPNQMKAFLRCGMGPCQGRFCATTVTELIADEQGREPADVGLYRLRFPTKPLTLGEMASMPQTEAGRRAVVRLKK